MAIAEVILRVKDESSKSITALTATSEGYDATLKRVVDSVAKEEAAERQRAAALGVTVGQLRLAEEALEKQIALERAAAQAAANRPVIEMPSGVYEQQAKATEDLGKANWQTVQAAQSLKKNLGDVVSSLVAGMDPIQVFTQQIEQIADALSQGESPAAVFKQALGGLFGLIASNAATLGTLTLAIGAAGVAYRVYGQEADRVYSRRAFDQELTESLRDSELGLRDAMLDQREAVGALTAQEAGLLRIRYAIQDQAREYASDNQKKIDALNEEIEATKKYINFQRGVAAELAVIYTFTIGAGDTVRRTTAGESVKEVAASNARAINDIIDSFTGLEAGSDDARAKIESLNQATQENASNLQETRKAQEEALKATLAGKDAKKEATAAEKEHTEELKRQKKYLEDLDNAYKRYIANQKILHDAIISNDPLAQENDRYQAYTDSILAATDALAAQAVHEGNLAEATRIRMEGLKALDAARLQHFQNTGAQGATNEASTYDQGLGGGGGAAAFEAQYAASQQAIALVTDYTDQEKTVYEKLNDEKKQLLDDYLRAATAAAYDQQKIATDTAAIEKAAAQKQTMTSINQGISSATSLTELVKVDPTGIASGILAGMTAVGSLSSSAAGIQSAKDAVKSAKDELAQAQTSGDAEEIKKATDGLKQAMDSLDGTLKAFNQTNALGQLQNLIDGVASGLPALGMAVSGMISGIIGDSIPALIGGIGDALMTIPEDLMGGILDGVPKLIEAMVKDAPKFMLELATLAPRIGFELIKELVKPDFWIGIADALVQGIGDGLTELWTTLLGFLGIDTSKQPKAGAFDRGGFFMEGGSADKAFGGTNEKGYKAGAFEKGGFFDRLFTGNTLPAYDVGSDFIAKSGLAVVHEGETVVPRHGATQAAAQDRMGNGRGNNYYLSGVIAANTEELVRHLREAERMGVSIG